MNWSHSAPGEVAAGDVASGLDPMCRVEVPHGDALFGVNRQLHTVGPERRAGEADRHDRPG